jgi:hypothetical protein
LHEKWVAVEQILRKIGRILSWYEADLDRIGEALTRTSS